MNDIIGRKREIEILDRTISSRKSEFVAIYGRRRVGKTFLVREYFKYSFDFQLTGLANATTEQQLNNFFVALIRQSHLEFKTRPVNWFEAFQLLIDHLESIQEQRKLVIFLDELPWMATSKSDFLISLEHFWNSWATNRKNIVLVVCGSAAAWMIQNLVNNTGGLHNRVTQRIKIHPFNLKETEMMLEAKNNILDRYQILQLYMTMGGIPYYIDAVSPNKSAAQNIEELAFRKGYLLDTEFQYLFNSLFKNASYHELVVTALASKTKGLTRNDISKITNIKTGGTLSKVLNELEESGFITRYNLFGKKSNSALYRLTDFYSYFYLKYLKHNTNYEEGVWVNAIDHPSQRAWFGYAFEQVCINHIPQIKKALSIGGVISQSSSWKSKNAEKGAQVDLLIDRRDQVINLCEVKFSINPYTITKSYAENLRNKIGVFKRETKTKKTVFLTMITTHGVEQNKHSLGLVQNQITMNDLFE